MGSAQSFATPWTVACQAPLPIEFSRQEYWSRLPFPSPGDLPDPGRGSLLHLLPWQAGAFPLVPSGRSLCWVISVNSLVTLVTLLSCVRLFATPWTVPARLLHPWDFPGKITGVACHFLLQGNLPNPGIEPGSPAVRVDALLSEPPGNLESRCC